MEGDDARESGSTVTIPAHPLGVKPAGNAYTSTHNLKSAAGYLASLPDELLVALLEYLDPEELLSLGSTCKALYAFSRHEELWKSQLIVSPPPFFSWYGNWFSSFTGRQQIPNRGALCKNLFSDVLHRPFLCAHAPLGPFTGTIPGRNRIVRMSNLTVSEFSKSWTDKPFILTQPVKEWPVYRDWTFEFLVKKFGNIVFRAEAVDWPLRTYIDYMNNTSDENPLYLFDHSFVEKMKLSVGKSGDYWIPDCFGEDLFAAMDEKRPDSRWLIVGPERSGSTFHKDPNATSAWNAVLQGSKYWIMFPPSPSGASPPGVFVSEDQSEVTSPLSITEWLLGFHAEARKAFNCMEGVCHAGEVLHVPSGWWHLVVNLGPSIAITQNFVPRAHVVDVLAFLKDKPDQVSGFQKDILEPYSLFTQALQAKHPEALAEASGQLTGFKRKRKWNELVEIHEKEEAKNQDGSEFLFGFGRADDIDSS